MKNLELIKNTLIYAIGSFGSKIISFLLIPLYSYYINAEDFGYYDLIITTVNLIVPFVTLQISDGAFRWLITSNGSVDVTNKVITTSTYIVLFNLLLLVLISVSTYFIYPLKEHFVILLLAVSSIIYPYLQQIARGLGKNKLYAANGIIYTFLFLVMNVIFLVFLKMSFVALFISSIISYGICSLIFLVQLDFNNLLSAKKYDFSFLKELIKYSLPLVPNTVSWWLVSSANKYIVLYYLGVGMNGIFAMSNRFPVILMMINSIFTLAWQETAIKQTESDEKKIDSTVFEFLTKIQFFLVAILSLLSQFFCEAFLSEEYLASWYYMPILYLSVAFLSFASYYGAFYLGTKSTSLIFKSTLYSAIITMISSVLLVQILGLFGVSIAILLGYFFMFYNRKKGVKRMLIVEFPYRVFVNYMLICLFAIGVSYMENMIYNVSLIIILSLLFLYDNRLWIVQIKQKIKR